MLKYKGYTGIVEFDDEANILLGRVVDVNAVITFEAKNAASVKKAFRDSVDCYIETCAKKNIEPKKSFSGNIRLRIPPQIHEKAYITATQRGESLNQLITNALSNEIGI